MKSLTSLQRKYGLLLLFLFFSNWTGATSMLVPRCLESTIDLKGFTLGSSSRMRFEEPIQGYYQIGQPVSLSHTLLTTQIKPKSKEYCEPWGKETFYGNPFSTKQSEGSWALFFDKAIKTEDGRNIPAGRNLLALSNSAPWVDKYHKKPSKLDIYFNPAHVLSIGSLGFNVLDNKGGVGISGNKKHYPNLLFEEGKYQVTLSARTDKGTKFESSVTLTFMAQCIHKSVHAYGGCVKPRANHEDSSQAKVQYQEDKVLPEIKKNFIQKVTHMIKSVKCHLFNKYCY
jgi:hypothetical protein